MFKTRPNSKIRRVIGLHGKAGCGKNYIGENIIAPLGFFPWAFAFHLKNGLIGRGLCTYDQAYHQKDPVVRKLMQEEGTERGRDVFGENLWVDTALAWLETASEVWGMENFVITDCRFPNEIQFVKDLGGKVYHIEAPTRTSQNGLSTKAQQHRSETSLDDFADFDGVINNDIGVSDVAEQVLTLLIRDGVITVNDGGLEWARVDGTTNTAGATPVYRA